MKTYVYCISALGQSFIGELVKENAPEGHKAYKTWSLKPDDKFAEVIDIEYNERTYQKWGYDCFKMNDKKWGKEARREFARLKKEGRI